MKNMHYTKSRVHEKLAVAKKMSCVITGLFLVSTVIMTTFAKEEHTEKYNANVEVITVEVKTDEVIGEQPTIPVYKVEKQDTSVYIRCTVYCDTGYTASGVWTTDGCLAGRKEWLGRKCKLYRVLKDGTKGECIGTFRFEDTGFGLEELNGVEYVDGTIKNGASIDMWHATEDECWDWVAKYGDYVYMEFIQ